MPLRGAAPKAACAKGSAELGAAKLARILQAFKLKLSIPDCSKGKDKLALKILRVEATPPKWH